MLVAALFVLASGNPAAAAPLGCSPAYITYLSTHPNDPIPPECLPYLSSRTSTSTSTTSDETREPPPTTGPVYVGSSGGTVNLGWFVVYFPPGVLPPGSTVTLTDYHPNSVPIGDAGAAFQGPGGFRLGVLIQDANGNVIHSLPPPGMTVGFVTGNPAWSQTPDSQRDIQLWNGRNWVDQPTDLDWNPISPLVVLSTTVTDF